MAGQAYNRDSKWMGNSQCLLYRLRISVSWDSENFVVILLLRLLQQLLRPDKPLLEEPIIPSTSIPSLLHNPDCLLVFLVRKQDLPLAEKGISIFAATLHLTQSLTPRLSFLWLANVDASFAQTPKDHLSSWARLPWRGECKPRWETKYFLRGLRIESLVELAGKAPLLEKADDTFPILTTKEVLEFIERLAEILNETTGSKTFLRIGIVVETLLEIVHSGVG